MVTNMTTKPKTTTGVLPHRVSRIEEIKAVKRQIINSFTQTSTNLKCAPDTTEPQSRKDTQPNDNHVFEEFNGIPKQFESYGYGMFDYKKSGSPKSIATSSNVDIKLLEQEKVSLVD